MIALVGPTATGKTPLSLQLAKELSCGIISADSRQFYREMNIGTAKIQPSEMQGIPHYFIDFISVREDYNAGKYEENVLKFLEEYFGERNVVLLAGGSGMYIQAVCEGMDNIPPSDKITREKLIAELKEKGMESLLEKLKELDREYYKTVDKKNPHRITRALEVCLLTGVPYSSLRKSEKGSFKKRNFRILKIGLELPREELYERINQRVDEMIERGLMDEAKKLWPYRHLHALQTVGYEELFDHFENKISLEEAVELIKRNTRRYAKRQMTWFRKDREIHWFHPEEKDKIISFVKNFLRD